MKITGVLLVMTIAFGSCVPAKKYHELLEKEQKCSEELEKYKSDAINFGSQVSGLKSENEVLMNSLSTLKSDTSRMGQAYRTLRAKYNDLANLNNALETSYDKLRLTGAKETAILKAELDKRAIELQKKEDQLIEMEKALNEREQKIKAQEERLAELNAIIKKQEDASRLLKEKVAAALKGFKNQGLTVVEKDGKIYVNMEAKLLFKSGSTEVEPEGKKALVELAKVLENEKDLEIIVEGHTDTDAMSSSNHPTNNWELSVLRSTSVISIMTDNSHMEPSNIMAAGRSEYHPVDPNDKAKNRRIEVIISPDLDALYELIKE